MKIFERKIRPFRVKGQQAALGQLVLILTCICIWSCVEVVEWPLQSGDNGQLVVEGILTNQQKIQEVRLSQSFDDLDSPVVPVENALVRISSGSETFTFRKSILEPGLYLSNQSFSADKDRIYTLSIFWKDEIYEATGKLSFVAPLDRISFDRSEGPDSLTIRQVAPVYHPLEQAMYEIFIEWPGTLLTSHARLFYYTFSTIDGNEIFRPATEEVYFPRGSRLIINKYGLDAEFADYLRTLVMETQWQGGLFDEASSSLESNISNGALGYFSVCAVISDTLIAR